MLMIGAFYAFVLILAEALEVPIKAFNKKFAWTQGRAYSAFKIIRTFFIVSVGMFFIKMPTLSQGFAYESLIFSKPIAHVASKGAWPVILGLETLDFVVLIVALIVWSIVSILNKKCEIRDCLAKINIVPRWLIFIVMIKVVVLAGFYGGSLDAASFIYQGF